MKIVIIVVVVLGFLGWLIYLAKKNEKLENEIKEANKLKEKQIQITKAYEESQRKADEIKNKKEEQKVEATVDFANDAIASFNNRVQNNK